MGSPLDSLSFNPYMFKYGNYENYDFNNMGYDMMTNPWNQYSMFPQFPGYFQPTTFDAEKNKQEKLGKLQVIKEDQIEEIEKIKNEKAEIKTDVEKRTTKKKEKLGFWKGAGKFFKGVGKSVTGMVTDKNGKFSIKKTLTTVAIAAAAITLEVVTAGAATPFLVAAGVAMAGGQVIQGGIKLSQATTAEEKARALEDMGEGTGGLALSCIGARAVRGVKIKNATKLAEGLAPKANKLGFLGKDAVASIRTSKGNKKVINASLEELATLSKNKRGFKEFNKDINTRLGKNTTEFTKPSINKDFARLSSKYGKSTEIKAAIAEFQNATSKEDAINALTKLEALAQKANTPSSKGKFNELEVLISKANKELNKTDIRAMAKQMASTRAKKGLKAVKENPNVFIPIAIGASYSNFQQRNEDEILKAQENVQFVEQKTDEYQTLEQKEATKYETLIDALAQETFTLGIRMNQEDIKFSTIEEAEKVVKELEDKIKKVKDKAETKVA